MQIRATSSPSRPATSPLNLRPVAELNGCRSDEDSQPPYRHSVVDRALECLSGPR
jgi:hypothetical protein